MSRPRFLADPDLQALRQAHPNQLLAPEPPPDIKDLAAQFLVLVTCRDEKDQADLLVRLREEGRKCKALLVIQAVGFKVFPVATPERGDVE